MTTPKPTNPDEPIALVGGMNDVLVTVASVLIQFAVGGLAMDFLRDSGSVWLVMVVNLATACVLAEVFVRRKRLRLTGLVLTCIVVGNVWVLVMFLFPWAGEGALMNEVADATSFEGQGVAFAAGTAAGGAAAAAAAERQRRCALGGCAFPLRPRLRCCWV